jgi:sterol 3beta-glucosyltransferase
MRIVILATGSRGDVQPYLALGVGLSRAGHSVRFVTHQNYSELVQSYGLEFWQVDINVQDITQSETMQKQLEKGSFASLLVQMAREARQGAVHLAEIGLAASQGMDLILAGVGGLYTGIALSEKLGIPIVQAFVFPFTPTRGFPSVLTPSLPSVLGGKLNRLSHHGARQMMWQGFRAADSHARQRVLGLPSAPFLGPYKAAHIKLEPVLYGFSPTVIPTPADWEEHIHVTGFWFLEAPEDWTPPSALIDFLEAGPAPVYIGFGSMSSRKPGETAEIVIEALKRSGQRAVLLSGWGGMTIDDIPEHVFLIDSIPHDWLFPHMAAVVHHGGAGTTAAGLRAGVPNLVIPFFGDQPFWGQLIHETGCGPEPIPRRKLTADSLARALREMASDDAMQHKAAQVGAAIRAEDGLARAVEIISRMEKQAPT